MDSSRFIPFTMRLGYRLVSFDRPVVMGIVNATPDSFYSPSRVNGTASICRRIEAMVRDGADIIDVGAYSSRPGASDVSAAEETDRLCETLAAIRSVAPCIPVSVDTFRASVARAAISMGADIINDISGGNLDPDMLPTVAALRVPFIASHMRGTPATMQSLTDYTSPGGVQAAVAAELLDKVHRLSLAGVADVIVDPGLGFAKTTEQNYQLLNSLPSLRKIVERPILIGLSRKSMITRPLGIAPANALPATTAMNLYALLKGASIIRVHDVAQAVEARALATLIQSNP